MAVYAEAAAWFVAYLNPLLWSFEGVGSGKNTF